MAELNATLCPDIRVSSFKYFFPRVGFEPTTFRVYSHTLVSLRLDWFLSKLFDQVFLI